MERDLDGLSDGCRLVVRPKGRSKLPFAHYLDSSLVEFRFEAL